MLILMESVTKGFIVRLTKFDVMLGGKVPEITTL